MPKRILVMPVKAIEKLPPGFHAVAECLYLSKTATGGASWVFRYVVKGRKTNMGIGSARELSRDEAIAEVARLQAMRKAGIDPLAERRAAVIAGAATASPTFKACALDYHTANAGTWSKSHGAAWLLEMQRGAFPAIGDLPVDRIEVADVLKALAGWTTTHETTSRNRGRIEKVLDAAKVQGHRKGENPAAWRGNLEHLLPSPKAVKGKEKAHHAAMDWREVPAFLAQLPDSDEGNALRFLILTATRTNETRDAAWSEIDFAARTWTIPAERMKARRPHVMPLSAPALAILQGLQRTGDLIFPIGRDAMSELVPSGSTVHGMRAAFSSWAGELELPRDTVEKCLAHEVGSQVERAYRRGAEIEAKRRVMERWALFIEGEQHNILTLDARRA